MLDLFVLGWSTLDSIVSSLDTFNKVKEVDDTEAERHGKYRDCTEEQLKVMATLLPHEETIASHRREDQLPCGCTYRRRWTYRTFLRC